MTYIVLCTRNRRVITLSDISEKTPAPSCRRAAQPSKRLTQYIGPPAGATAFLRVTLRVSIGYTYTTLNGQLRVHYHS